MRKTVLLGLCGVVALSAAACQDQLAEPQSEPTSPVADVQVEFRAVSPGTFEFDRAEPYSEFELTDAYIVEAADRAINPGNHVCPATTPLIDELIADINEVAAEGGLPLLAFIVNELGAADVPSFDALLFQTDDVPQSYGSDGQFTNVVNRTDGDLRRFWDIFSDDIQLLAMHGSVLLDVERVVPTYQFLLGISAAEALAVATFVRDVVLAFESLDGGDFPFFTFNAFAFRGTPSSPVGPIPPKIVLGDGVLETYEDLGFGDVAAQGIFAHEFAHHIQFKNGYFETDVIPSLDPAGADAAEATRYFELMADAYAAYYLTHKRGATLNWWRVEQFLKVFFNVGDCAFDNPNHHGTPNQRLRAARFGFDVASDAQMQGKIMTSDEFHDLFVENYLDFVQPDAGTGTEDPTVGPGKSRAAR